MDKIVITSARHVTEADLREAHLSSRFSRLDKLSQLAVLAVELLGVNFDQSSRDRTGICLAARAGSLSTDLDYWEGRDRPGGPSPTLFAYTLPSAAVGEIAIRYRLRGPSLCFVGTDSPLLAEASDLIQRGEADACVCLSCDVVTLGAAAIIGERPGARVDALFMRRGGEGLLFQDENDRDIAAWCALFYRQKSPS